MRGPDLFTVDVLGIFGSVYKEKKRRQVVRTTDNVVTFCQRNVLISQTRTKLLQLTTRLPIRRSRVYVKWSLFEASWSLVACSTDSTYDKKSTIPPPATHNRLFLGPLTQRRFAG
jgi:hypothetical protein